MPKKMEWPLKAMFTMYREGKTLEEIAKILSSADWQRYWRKTLGYEYCPVFQVLHKVMVRAGCKMREQGASGEANGNWKGGRTIDKCGYVQIRMPTHPFADSKGYVREHRLVMEQHLGRYLTKEEVIHHIDCNKQNNHLSNLMLFANNGEHLAYELTGRPRKKKPKSNDASSSQ